MEDYSAIWGIVGIIVVILTIRGAFIRSKRELKNNIRAIVEVRDPNVIAAEEEAVRSVRAMEKEYNRQEMEELKKQEKKAKGLFAGGGSTEFCANCGAALKQNAKFCSKCGSSAS